MSYKPEINPFTGKLQLVPTQSDADITSAVEKKHDQNTDQYLDYGGGNQIGANEVTKKLTASVTYFVNCDTGNDNNAGTSASPFQTIAKAITLIPDNLNNRIFTIRLQDSLNYNESININAKFAGRITIISQSNDATKVLISSALGHAIGMVDSDAFIKLQRISVKVTLNDKNCVNVDNAHCYLVDVLLGDNGNTGTKGVNVVQSARATLRNVSDIDSNKVSTGIFCSNGYVQVSNSLFGDINYSVSNEGIITNNSIIIDKTDYEDAITKKHTQNLDTNLIVPEGTIVDVEQLLFKSDEFYPINSGTSYTAQTFVALRNGEIPKISVIAQASGTPDAPMILELRTTDGEGKPTDTVLGSSSVDYGDLVALNDYTDFVLASPITGITKDTKYAIILRTEATIGGYEFRFSLNAPYGEWYDFNDPNWVLDDSLSYAFKVYITLIQADLIEEGNLKTDLFVDDDIEIDGRDISEDGTKLDTLKEIPIYEQADEPVLIVDGSSAFWYDINDNYRCYLIHRRGDKGSGIAEQIKTELI